MRRAGWIAALLVCLLVLPLIFVGALLSLSGGQPSPSDKARAEIPSRLIGLYQAAAATCEGLEWTILAAIHKVESGFGTGAVTSPKGAQGPMQFMPATFEHYGVDGDGDGATDINNVTDAVFSAANYLCANGGGNPARLATSIWNYNHSATYVDQVLTLASSYGVFRLPDGVALASATDLLGNPKVILTPQARGDLQAGAVDDRLVSLIAWIAQRHTIGVTVFTTGHSKYTRSGTISNHYYGRGADVYFVDGEPVSGLSAAAHRLVREVAALEGPLCPDELGHPFGAIGFPGGFTDADHADHIHLGFDQ